MKTVTILGFAPGTDSSVCNILKQENNKKFSNAVIKKKKKYIYIYIYIYVYIYIYIYMYLKKKARTQLCQGHEQTESKSKE